MISSYFHGEMGNNMFQLAAALGHAQKLDVETEFSYWRNYKVSITEYPLELPTMFDYTFNFKENSVHPFEMYLHPDFRLGSTPSFKSHVILLKFPFGFLTPISK